MLSTPRMSLVLERKLIATNYKKDLKLDNIKGRLEETRLIEEQQKTFCSDTRKWKNSISVSCRHNVQQQSSHLSWMETLHLCLSESETRHQTA
jgi:hypothetical protein